jgi:hypothetical protein
MEFAFADGFLMGPLSSGVSSGVGEAGPAFSVGTVVGVGELGVELLFDVSVFSAHAAIEKIISDTNSNARIFFIFILLQNNIKTFLILIAAGEACSPDGNPEPKSKSIYLNILTLLALPVISARQYFARNILRFIQK